MQRPVGEHIQELERLVRQLTAELMRESDLRARNELEGRIRAAEMALSHYHAALQVEQSLTRDQG